MNLNPLAKQRGGFGGVLLFVSTFCYFFSNPIVMIGREKLYNTQKGMKGKEKNWFFHPLKSHYMFYFYVVFN